MIERGNKLICLTTGTNVKQNPATNTHGNGQAKITPHHSNALSYMNFSHLKVCEVTEALIWGVILISLFFQGVEV